VRLQRLSGPCRTTRYEPGPVGGRNAVPRAPRARTVVLRQRGLGRLPSRYQLVWGTGAVRVPRKRFSLMGGDEPLLGPLALFGGIGLATGVLVTAGVTLFVFRDISSTEIQAATPTARPVGITLLREFGGSVGTPTPVLGVATGPQAIETRLPLGSALASLAEQEAAQRPPAEAEAPAPERAPAPPRVEPARPAPAPQLAPYSAPAPVFQPPPPPRPTDVPPPTDVPRPPATQEVEVRAATEIGPVSPPRAGPTTPPSRPTPPLAAQTPPVSMQVVRPTPPIVPIAGGPPTTGPATSAGGPPITLVVTTPTRTAR